MLAAHAVAKPSTQRFNRSKRQAKRKAASPAQGSRSASTLSQGSLVEVPVLLSEPDDSQSLRERAAKQLGCDEAELPPLRLLKRSLDARRHQVRHHWLFELSGGDSPEGVSLSEPEPVEVKNSERILIVGGGPAGLFCAYQLARFGIGSTVLERGKPVQPRRHDLKALNRGGTVNPDSNYCFGEGGAGTYSDGKLYTRSHKRGNLRDVLELLAAHGAPSDILTEARPHIGSNLLPKVVTALREHLERLGVVFRFDSRVVDLLKDAGGKCVGLKVQTPAGLVELGAERVVLATGHSASSIYEMLLRHGAPLEPKPFAVGVRIEHPQQLINQIQYGKYAGHERLRSAAYRLVCQVEEGRGVFSFCMCPGGFIVPASTEPGHLVVNGMSLKRRDSPFANSGLVVQISVEDIQRAVKRLGLKAPSGLTDAQAESLLGVQFQRNLERLAFEAGGGNQVAPASRVTDFLAGRASSTAGETSYLPGLRPTDLREVLDGSGFELSRALQAALTQFGQDMPGYVSDEAWLLGVESRTSSPARVLRDPATLNLVGDPAIFPSGEGAGYAGGIISAAVDGIRVAHAVRESLRVTQ